MRCKDCNGCYKFVWIGFTRYIYCTFCRKLYEVVDGNLVEITNQDFIRQAREITGNRV